MGREIDKAQQKNSLSSPSLVLTTAPCSSPPAWPVVFAGARARRTSTRWSSGHASRPLKGVRNAE